MASHGVQNECEQIQNHSISDDKNPMLIPVVVQTFLQVCDLKDLRRFRLVSKLWHDLSLQRWRDEMVIIIGSGKYRELRRDDEEKILFRQRLHWRDLSLLYEAPSISRKPFKKYILGSWEFPITKESRETFPTLESWEHVESFWRRCGPWMMELTMESPRIKSAEMFRKVLVEDTRNLVSLKLTRMDAFSFGNTETLEKVETQGSLKSISINLGLWEWHRVCFDPDRAILKPIPWFELLRCFPNIQELEWKEFHDFESVHLINAWNELIRLGKNVDRKLKIKCSSINRQDQDRIGPPCDPSLLKDFLQYQHFTFPHLQIHQTNLNSADADIDDEGILAMALQRHQNTLESLELSSSDRVHFKNTFQTELQFLSKLSLSNTCVPSYHFLKSTPNLTSLNIANQPRFSDMKTNTRHREMKDVRLEKLGCLDLNLEFMINESDSTLKMFSRWMPNVTVLKCFLNNKSFRLVCKCWPGLRELVDLGEVLDNSAITGIVPGKMTRLPNITNLKYLREFRTESSLLSDQSVSEGFLPLANLTGLEVSLSSKTSNAAYSALFERFRTGVKRSQPRKGYMLQSEFDLNDELEERSRELSKEYDICPQIYFLYAYF